MKYILFLLFLFFIGCGKLNQNLLIGEWTSLTGQSLIFKKNNTFLLQSSDNTFLYGKWKTHNSHINFYGTNVFEQGRIVPNRINSSDNIYKFQWEVKQSENKLVTVYKKLKVFGTNIHYTNLSIDTPSHQVIFRRNLTIK